MEWPNKWIDFWGRLFLSAFLHTVFCYYMLIGWSPDTEMQNAYRMVSFL